jgi:hypothetical protein
MTGNPMPRTPAEQMALAPQVYQFSRQLEQRPSGIRQFIDTAGRAALGAGLLTGATLLGAKLAQQAPGAQPRRATSGFEPDDLIPGQSESVGTITGQAGKIMPEATTPGSEEDLIAQAIEHTEGDYSGFSSPEQKSMDELRRQALQYASNIKLAGEDVRQQVIGRRFNPEVGPGIGGLMLDDEPQVDNDVVAAEPLSTVGKVSKDVTTADPASDINQRVLPAQTQTRVDEARATPQPTTVAENLATKQSPVHTAREFVGRKSRELQEKAELARKYMGTLSPAKALAALGGQEAVAAPEAQVAPTAIEVAPTAREVTAASFSTNPYLSAMSQAEGPTQTYGIDPKRSRAISEMTFYPGGELGVELQTKRGPKEYVYAMSDPYREAVGQYAEEGFPSGMGQIGRIATPKATAVSLGVQRPVGEGGVPTGAESKVLFKETPEARDVRLGLEERAAARESSVEEGDRTTFRGSPAAAFLKKKAIETIGKIAESPV